MWDTKAVFMGTLEVQAELKTMSCPLLESPKAGLGCWVQALYACL